MKKTLPPGPEDTQGGRQPGKKRIRADSVRDELLESLMTGGARKPRGKLETAIFTKVAAQGFLWISKDGAYSLTDMATEYLKTPRAKSGRPSKFTGPWGDLTEAYGGVAAFAEKVPCAENTVRRWALHDVVPIPITMSRVAELAKAVNLPSPFENMV